MYHIWSTILKWLFPEQCCGCRAWGELLCANCIAKLAPAPPRPLPLPLAARYVGFQFGGVLRAALHRLKYRRERRMALPLAKALARAIRHQLPPGAALMAVPLHPKRLAERGFNQAALLAEALAAECGRPPPLLGLVRIRATAQQARLGRDERLRNLEAAFVWQGPAPPPRAVLLVDDVLTTGATLAAAAQALHAAGCEWVGAVALASA